MIFRTRLAARGAAAAILMLSLILPNRSTPTLQNGLPAPVPTVDAAGEYVPGEIVVKFRSGTASSLQAGVHDTVGGQQGRHIDGLGVDVVAVSQGVGAALAAYRRSPHVLYAEPNYLIRAQVEPNDPKYAVQWNLPRVEAQFAWDLAAGGDGTVIAVIDTGIAPDHPDLKAKLLPGYNVFQRNDATADDLGHGTHVASIAAAAGNDAIGMAGVCWSCRILPVKALDSVGTGTAAGAADGIRWAVDHGARVINMSWGMVNRSEVLAEAIAYARSRGVVLVTAAGNMGNDTVFYPAAFEGVIGVGATDRDDRIAPFSNHGDFVALAAPGVQIEGAEPKGGYVTLSGTSMAAPHVAGAAGLMLSVQPALTAEQVGQILLSKSEDRGAPGRDPYYGAGRLNVFRAVAAAQPTSVPRRFRVYLPSIGK
ncbi:MAG: peptidase S8 [Chloroflexi bacterium]|nr:peptidase S8 [Chloroflexota bacterium]